MRLPFGGHAVAKLFGRYSLCHTFARSNNSNIEVKLIVPDIFATKPKKAREGFTDRQIYEIFAGCGEADDQRA